MKNVPVIICEIRDSFGHVESGATRLTLRECEQWYREHGVSMKHVTVIEKGYTFTRKARKDNELAAETYIRSLHSAAKKEYAWGYWHYLNGSQSMPVASCSYMAAQAVRMNLDALFGDDKQVRDIQRFDSVYYPGCSVCKAKTGSKHFVGCTYRPPSEGEIIDHYRRSR